MRLLRPLLSTLLERIGRLTPDMIDQLSGRSTKVIDDVFLASVYPKYASPSLPLSKAFELTRYDFEMERDMNPFIDPARTNLLLRIELAKLSEKKATRLIEATVPKIVLLPHPHKEERRVMAAVAEEQIQDALDAGAVIADTPAVLVPSLLDMTYEAGEEFHVLVASDSSILKELAPVRKKLEKIFPVKHKQTLGGAYLPLDRMIRLNRYGQYYEYSMLTSETVDSTEVKYTRKRTITTTATQQKFPGLIFELGTMAQSADALRDNLFCTLAAVAGDCGLGSSRELVDSTNLTRLSLQCSKSLSKEIDLQDIAES